MSTFSAIPKIPEGVGDEWETDILSALSRNVSLLSGEIRGSRALLKEMITVQPLLEEEFFNLSAVGKRRVLSPQEFLQPTFSAALDGFISVSMVNSTILNEDTLTELFGTEPLVPESEDLIQLVTLDDYNNLLRDVLRLSQDVQAIRVTLSALISQIRG